MQETNHEELMEAIKLFKSRYGVHTPLDMFKLDDIIEELRKKKEENGK